MTNEYLIREAEEKDIAFLADVAIAAEKGMSDKLSYSTLFNISEEKAKQLIIQMFEEEIDGCELSLSSFLVVEFEGKPVAALGGWIEAFGENLPSQQLKANLIGYTFPPESLEFLRTKSQIIKEIYIERELLTLQFEYLYVLKEHLGSNLHVRLMNEHENRALKKFPELKKVQTQPFKTTVFSIKLLLKQGFKIVGSSKSERVEISKLLPSNEKYAMEKQIEK